MSEASKKSADERVCWLNAQWIPASHAQAPLSDLSLWGLAVTEMLRTYRGKVLFAKQHTKRLLQSARLTGIAAPTASEFEDVLNETVRRNAKLVEEAGDIGLSVCLSAGQNPLLGQVITPGYADGGAGVQSVVPFPLPMDAWRELKQNGQALVTTDIQQISPDTMPPEIKCRSRMHWRLADQQAQQIEPGARALLLDQQGLVAETSAANICIVRAGRLLTPDSGVLAGITRDFVFELAAQLDIVAKKTPIKLQDVLDADEVFLTSSLMGLCPVSRINGKDLPQVGGAIYQKIAAAFRNKTGTE